MHGDECRPLTIREQFAVAAMQGILAHGVESPPFASADDIRRQVGREAWAMADVMLSALYAPQPMQVGVEDDGEPE